MPASGSDAPSGQIAPSQDREILVIGPRLFPDVTPERELSEGEIEGYGESTVDGLLAEVQGELGDDDEQALILVNGERINDPQQIGGLPVEALRRVQVLPRGSAVRLGGSSTQRVINIALRDRVRSATLTAADKVATRGDWRSLRGETILTSIKGPTTINFALRGRDDSDLLESDRGIIQPAARLPYALDGNVVGYPGVTGEIDPALSGIAGTVVTVAPLPSSPTPTLADFASDANSPATTDLGAFRTLRPTNRNLDANLTFGTRVAPWLTTTSTLRLTRSRSRSLRGLASALFVVPDSDPSSPFASPVGVALYRPGALESRSRRNGLDFTSTWNARFGTWTGNLATRYSTSRDRTTVDRTASSSTIFLDGSTDAFATNLAQLISIRGDTALGRSTTASSQLTLTGPAVKLPAGPLIASIEARAGLQRLGSSSSFSGNANERRFRRDETGARVILEAPLTSRDLGILPFIGDLTATAEFAVTHYSDAGTLDAHVLGLSWTAAPWLRLRGETGTSERPAPIQTLGSPVIVTPQVRIFDPLTGDTVDVVQVSGGNPNLAPERTRLRRLSGTARLVERLNLNFNAEYSDSDERDFISSLPEASAAIALAFPDRFVRDANGQLIRVDYRPVNFASHREKRIRYGLSLSTSLGGGPPVAARTESEDEADPAVERPTRRASVNARAAARARLQLSLNHNMVFLDRIEIRPALETVDLLEGGAIGIGGGRVRHQIDASASLSARGTGVRLTAGWRGPSTLQSRIGTTTETLRFDPLFTTNVRAFTDLRRVFPGKAWANRTRLSLNVVNLTDGRQSVRDSFGQRPLQYQAGYRDPIGRTIELEIRKVF